MGVGEKVGVGDEVGVLWMNCGEGEGVGVAVGVGEKVTVLCEVSGEVGGVGVVAVPWVAMGEAKDEIDGEMTEAGVGVKVFLSVTVLSG